MGSRLTYAVVGLICSGLLLAGCVPAVAPPAPATSAKLPVHVPKVTIAIAGDENNATPYSTTNLSGMWDEMVSFTYDSLMKTPYGLVAEPWLAESAVPDANAREWLVRVRQDVKWQDGQPFTVDDVKFTYDYYHNGPTNRYAHHTTETPAVDRVEIVDRAHVRFVCGEPCPSFDIITLADLPILPKHIWESIQEPNKATTQLPIGTGPYQMVEHVSDQLYRFKANPNYFMGAPLVDELVMPIAKEPSSMFLALKTGQVDAASRQLPAELLDEFRSASDVKVVQGSRFLSSYLAFNSVRAPWTSTELRKAILLAMDETALVNTILLGKGRPGNDGFVHPDSPWSNPNLPHQYDPAAANAMLDRANFVTRDGVRTADGKSLDLEILVSSTDPRGVRVAEIIASQLTAIGLRGHPVVLDPTTVSKRRNSGDFDAYISDSTAHLQGDPDQLVEAFLTFLPFKNPEFTRLTTQWLRSATLESRKALFFQMQELVAQDPVAFNFYYPDEFFAYRPSAYDRWVPVPGHSIIHRWSFLPNGAAPPARSALGMTGA